MKSIGVIGGGISGVSFARMIGDNANVHIYEKQPIIGGLIRCDRVNGYLYHLVGGHLFNAKNPQILKWFWNFFNADTEFIKAERKAKIFLNNTLVGYPIEDHIFQLDKHTAKAVINELVSKDKKDAEDFESFLLNNFGNTLHQLYFKPYNEKIWNTDLSKVPLPWLEGKLPMPAVNDILLNNIFRQQETKMVHSWFYYPKVNGSQFLIDRLAQGLKITTGFQVRKIEKTADGLFINDEGPFNHIVYTGDVRQLASCVDGLIPSSLAKKISSLQSNGTTNVLCTCDANDLSWLYIPEEKFRAHRIVYTGNFSATNNLKDGRISCTVEFSNFVSEEQVKKEIKDLPGNMEFLAYNFEPNSYIIQNAETRELINEYREILEDSNIFLLGRFAEWEYYNMDKAMEAAWVLSDKLGYIVENNA